MQEIEMTADAVETDEAAMLQQLSDQLRLDRLRYERKLNAEEEMNEN